MRRMRFLMGLPVAMALAGGLIACKGSPTAPTPPPTSPQTSTPGPPPIPIPQVGITLSGVVFESTSQGRRPLSGGHVWYFVAAQSAILGVHGSTSLDANGRYVISDLPNGHRVKVNAFVPQTLGQPCAARAAMTASSVLDIELVRPGARPTTNSSPTLSGVVFEMTAEGRRPLAGIPVGFYGDAFPGMVDVFTWTGTDGRYEFCNLPIGAGNLLAGDCLNDQMMSMPVEISGDMTKDFELTRLDCPR